ncbi:MULTISPECIES: hypothetical protein [unclassified Streptomyces]|uniref:hypothetical protein n=1 Tax=unclassified Streptomyces TaxID=2593676 RepID=UPI003816E028
MAFQLNQTSGLGLELSAVLPFTAISAFLDMRVPRASGGRVVRYGMAHRTTATADGGVFASTATRTKGGAGSRTSQSLIVHPAEGKLFPW